MKLSQLFTGVSYRILSGPENPDIINLAYNSNEVTPGTLFIALTGFAADGHAFIPAALEKGAGALLVEKDPEDFPAGVSIPEGVTLIRVEDTREVLFYIAANYFGHPAEKLTLVGVTGTKGKTTTTHMCRAILAAAGEKAGLIGTIGCYTGERWIETKNTTPESFELQKFFAEMVKAGVRICFMEVSSQAVKKNRIRGLRFAIGGFTNLSPDHIAPGEHADFAEYKYYKKEFFRQVETAVINKDDPYGPEMAENVPSYRTFSHLGEADIMSRDAKNIWEGSLIGVSFRVSGDVKGDMIVSVPGLHNAENALLAAEICHLLGVSDEAIRTGLRNVTVRGRTQFIPEAASRGTFFIDYAHNAVSAESVLTTLRAYNPTKLTCLFGSGGNRAVSRRYDMGMTAAKYADYIIVTEDNPRFEEIDEINRTIIEGIRVYGCPYEVINDRKKAIEHLLDISKPGEIVCLLGKGHETYMEEKGVRYPFSEEQIIKDYMKNKGNCR